MLVQLMDLTAKAEKDHANHMSVVEPSNALLNRLRKVLPSENPVYEHLVDPTDQQEYVQIPLGDLDFEEESARGGSGCCFQCVLLVSECVCAVWSTNRSGAGGRQSSRSSSSRTLARRCATQYERRSRRKLI